MTGRFFAGARIIEDYLPALPVDKIIACAVNKFIDGFFNTSLQCSAISKKPELLARYRPKTVQLSVHDPLFSYNANRIPDSNFIASAGPQTAIEAEKYLKEMLFQSEFSVPHIINFCTSVTNRPFVSYQHDFYDYHLQVGRFTYTDLTVLVCRLSGEVQVVTTNDSEFSKPLTIVQSELQVITPTQHRNVIVTTIPLLDGTSFDLTTAKDSEQAKAIFWQLYQASKTNKVVAHCAGGIGRTGQFIFMLELLKQHDEIFNAPSPEIASNLIHTILARLRSVRAALVTNKSQFECAIRNARLLYQYGLEKGYISHPGTPWPNPTPKP